MAAIARMVARVALITVAVVARQASHELLGVIVVNVPQEGGGSHAPQGRRRSTLVGDDDVRAVDRELETGGTRHGGQVSCRPPVQRPTNAHTDLRVFCRPLAPTHHAQAAAARVS